MKKDKSKLDTFAEAGGKVAVESDPQRQLMEEAILATVAIHGLGSGKVWPGFNTLAWSRADFAAIAGPLGDCIRSKIRPDPVIIKDRLNGVRVEDKILAGILDGSKARDISTVEGYIDLIERQDHLARTEELARALEVRGKNENTTRREINAAITSLKKGAQDLMQKGDKNEG